MSIRIPKYTLAEELWNSISHGLAAIFAIVATILMIVKANTALEYVTVSVFGTTMIILYIISCIYHALSRRLTGKKVLRVIDHCNVYLLVLGTYTPVALLGVGDALGWWLFGFVTIVSIIGITLSAVATDRFQTAEVICHLLNGWSILIGLPKLYEHMGLAGVILLFLGGLAYTLGAIFYQLGAKRRYIHSVFHFFCITGTVLQWCAIYLCLL